MITLTIHDSECGYNNCQSFKIHIEVSKIIPRRPTPKHLGVKQEQRAMFSILVWWDLPIMLLLLLEI